MVGFFPIVTNERLARDADLAELLDHFSFNLGMATDSLVAHGFRVTMQSGDTLWLRTTSRKWRFVRATDSAMVGFYLASPNGRPIVRYGSGTEFSLLALGDTFARAARTDSTRP
jgi:hypothetical protein